jgi:hypothetical protein
LTGLVARTILYPLPDGVAIGRHRFAAAETCEVPVRARARRGLQLQRLLAASLATLLAIAPFARPSWTVDLFALAAVAAAIHDDGPTQASEPAAGLRPAQPWGLGILSRLSSLESALGLPPGKSPHSRFDPADQPLLAPPVDKAFGVGLARIFHPSSVGTARTPTGPPS